MLVMRGGGRERENTHVHKGKQTDKGAEKGEWGGGRQRDEEREKEKKNVGGCGSDGKRVRV